MNIIKYLSRFSYLSLINLLTKDSINNNNNNSAIIIIVIVIKNIKNNYYRKLFKY
jgi:hypothetical protein